MGKKSKAEVKFTEKPAAKKIEKPASKPAPPAKSPGKKAIGYKDLKEIGERWVVEYAKALNNSSTYEESAKGWGIDFEGAMLFVLEKSGEIADDLTVFLDLKDGKCLGIKLLAPGEKPPRPAGFTLSASFLIWKKLAFKELNPIQSIMQGKLLVQGDMTRVMRYARAAMELANAVEHTDATLFTKYDLGEAE
nr:SCP2 sterol-binding domain-containing protein [Candidatus Sigynarchaeota archaeon]